LGQPKTAEPARLIVGALTAFPEAWTTARARLLELFGEIDLEAGPLDFNFTDYYREEMGAGLRRHFVSFPRLVAQDEIARIKHLTNELERELARPEWPVQRPVNLDPGYLTLGKLVLGTTKDQAHRIAVGPDIYAEVTLRCSGGRFVPQTWTYADYRTEAYHQFFAQVRQALHAQLRSSSILPQRTQSNAEVGMGLCPLMSLLIAPILTGSGAVVLCVTLRPLR
jgi:hypothetical protein